MNADESGATPARNIQPAIGGIPGYSDCDPQCRYRTIVAELLYQNQVLRFQLREAQGLLGVSETGARA